MPRISEQVEWLNLVDRSGPFLEAALLKTVFPQGMEKVESLRRQRIRSAYEEWRDAVDDDDPQLDEMNSAWVLMVLQDMLEYEDAVLVSRQALDGKCVYRAPEHGAEAVPDYAVRGDDGQYRMLVSVWPPEADLEKPVTGDPWPASPLERMTLLCRTNNVRVGMVTDGERWMVVNAPVGATSGYAAWLARLWWQEPLTLRAFQSLLGVRRCFGPKEETLSALLERSAEFQGEVTDTLGEQVRRAVEILIQSLGRADQDRNGELLKEVRPAELYEAGLTVMMRLVFTLCAEERGLLLLGDPAYDQHYAISTLRARLREDADRFGIEVLERRHDAWSRMLAVFRAIFGGVEHESLRMPALGGSLFDPDRFPMLEGRAKGTTWRDTPSVPLPIDNRTVLLLLDALQVLEQKGGAQLLSYRALDVEQIGHVYEGLLEYTVAKLDKITVGLVGSQSVRHPSITLSELEALKTLGQQKSVEALAELTGRSAAAIGRLLNNGGDDVAMVRLVNACGGDEQLARRLLPFADLVRADSWDTMLVYKPGSFAVVLGTDRRETGTHYTPKSLTESIVEKTLEPVVFVGPAEGEPRERWKLKTSAELLDLKVCDMAMGSGAFLVQVCRYLSERLVEAWAQREAEGKAITADGIVLDTPGESDPMPKSLDERLIIGRRLVAERCLYGVDINPLAVELAKLSIWLVTMARGRPFGFLDHNLRSGDSLLGIYRLDQLTKLTMTPDEPGHQQRLFGQNIGKAVESAVAIRAKLRAISIRDICDVERMSGLDFEARRELEAVEVVADAMISMVLTKSGRPHTVDSQLDALADDAGIFLDGDAEARKKLLLSAGTNMSAKPPNGRSLRRPFHWPLVFPEVFIRGGFDAFVGNPPFLGGSRISTVIGDDYLDYLRIRFPSSHGRADLCCFFFLQAFDLLNVNGCFGLVATNTIAQADSREAALDHITANDGTIYRATASIGWPGKAAVIVSIVHVARMPFEGPCVLGSTECASITPFLTSGEAHEFTPMSLSSQNDIAFHGSVILGSGFLLAPDVAADLIHRDPRNADVLFPFLTGLDVNKDPQHKPSRWVINFHDWPLDKAKTYRECFDIIDKLVRPQRETLKRDAYRIRWWQFGERQPKLYGLIKARSRVLVRPRVSNTHAPVFYNPTIIFSDAVVVFVLDAWSQFAVVQSSFHEEWARKYSSTMKDDLRYSTTDAFETFPFPLDLTTLEAIGQAYYEARGGVVRQRKEGLTKCYNRFHSREEQSEDIIRLRALHVEMDQAVAAAYGWGDLDLGHDFRATKKDERYTISEPACRAAFDRLLELNHKRYHDEVRAGRHGTQTRSANTSRVPHRRHSP